MTYPDKTHVLNAENVRAERKVLIGYHGDEFTRTAVYRRQPSNLTPEKGQKGFVSKRVVEFIPAFSTERWDHVNIFYYLSNKYEVNKIFLMLLVLMGKRSFFFFAQ